MPRTQLTDSALEEGSEEFEYLATHVGIALGRRFLTKSGLLIIFNGEVVLLAPGDGPVVDRVIAAEPASAVTVLSKPWIAFGTGMSMQVGETKFTVHPQVIYRGSGFVTLGRIRRARAAVEAFEVALEAAQRAGAGSAPDGGSAASDPSSV